MPAFSQSSAEKLKLCHPDLQTLFNEVVKYYDCKVTEGFRNENDQNTAYLTGKSKLKWPHGKHNSVPSCAVDVYFCPVDFKNKSKFYHFAGFVHAIAEILKRDKKIKSDIIWGGDWDSDKDFEDQKFNDLCHFEIK